MIGFAQDVRRYSLIYLKMIAMDGDGDGDLMWDLVSQNFG